MHWINSASRLRLKVETSNWDRHQNHRKSELTLWGAVAEWSKLVRENKLKRKDPRFALLPLPARAKLKKE